MGLSAVIASPVKVIFWSLIRAKTVGALIAIESEICYCQQPPTDIKNSEDIYLRCKCLVQIKSSAHGLQ
jgi:hypothetical protein